MIVGYSSGSYPYRRNIIGAVPGVRYKRVVDPYAVAGALGRRVNRLTRLAIVPANDLWHRFNDAGMWRVDLLHFFNTISYGPTPWITTFETIIPRFSVTLSCHHGPQPRFSELRKEESVRRALAAIAGGSCKRIIAISRCNARLQEGLLNEFPEFRQVILSKLTVMHPPQQVVVPHFSDKALPSRGPITFMLVGASFFRKGGREILDTLALLRARHGYPIRLLIVSSLTIDNYATKESPEDVRMAQRFIRENASWIDYYPQLPNHRVTELMRTAHVGLLPSHAETYGYVVLEFQAAGCPVITTDVRALPEINDPSRGWLIEVPKNHLGEALYTTPEQRSGLSSAIREGLERAVHEIFADRSLIASKGDAAIAYVAEHHSPRRYAEDMSAIYAAAVR